MLSKITKSIQQSEHTEPSLQRSQFPGRHIFHSVKTKSETRLTADSSLEVADRQYKFTLKYTVKSLCLSNLYYLISTCVSAFVGSQLLLRRSQLMFVLSITAEISLSTPRMKSIKITGYSAVQSKTMLAF